MKWAIAWSRQQLPFSCNQNLLPSGLIYPLPITDGRQHTTNNIFSTAIFTTEERLDAGEAFPTASPGQPILEIRFFVEHRILSPWSALGTVVVDIIMETEDTLPPKPLSEEVRVVWRESKRS